MNIIFMGSCNFSLSILKILHEEGGYNFVGVFTAPPKPHGRGHKICKTCVHLYAEKQGWPVFTPTSLKSNQQIFLDLSPDLIILASYGFLLPLSVLQIPTTGCINVHPSILPRWRGASPVQCTIMHGDEISGVSIMLMDEGMDTGPVLYQKVIQISKTINVDQLYKLLAVIGANALIDIIPRYTSGNLIPTPQSDQGVIIAHKLTKQDGALCYDQSAHELERKIRALNPWPGTWISIKGKKVKILGASVGNNECADQPIGTFFTFGNKKFGIVCAENTVLYPEIVQPEGKAAMDIKSFLCGHSVG